MAAPGTQVEMAAQSRGAAALNGAPYAGGGRKFVGLCRVDGAWKIASVLWEDD